MTSALYCTAWNADHLAARDIGQTLANHVVDLEPHERRQLGHVDPSPGVEFSVYKPWADGTYTPPVPFNPPARTSLKAITQALDAE